MMFEVGVTVTPLCRTSELDRDDAADPLLANGGTVRYAAHAETEARAVTLAEDQFHNTVAIAVLEDFYITSKARMLSAHERMEIEQTFPHLPTVLQLSE